MSDVYTRTVVGTVPVDCVSFKDYIRLPQVVVAEDSLITSLLSTACDWGERYTRRDFRDNTYELQLNQFPSGGICLRRDPVETITSITYLVGGVETTIDAADYYLLKGVQTSSIELVEDSDWPTDGDEDSVKGSITVTFTTQAYNCEDDINTAIKQHVAYLFSERGDCPAEDAAKKSGATGIYDQFRVSRV